MPRAGGPVADPRTWLVGGDDDNVRAVEADHMRGDRGTGDETTSVERLRGEGENAFPRGSRRDERRGRRVAGRDEESGGDDVIDERDRCEHAPRFHSDEGEGEDAGIVASDVGRQRHRRHAHLDRLPPQLTVDPVPLRLSHGLGRHDGAEEVGERVRDRLLVLVERDVPATMFVGFMRCVPPPESVQIEMPTSLVSRYSSMPS